MASESLVIIIIVVIIIIIIIIIHLAQGFGCSHADLYPKGAIQNKWPRVLWEITNINDIINTIIIIRNFWM